MTTDAQQQFQEVLAAFDNAMLVTRSPDGSLHARPMVIADREQKGDLWFVTSSESGKVDEILDNSSVAVTLQSSSKFLSLSGKASLSRDQSKIAELWSEPWKVWFPDGKDDPNLVLLKVTAEVGEYWDNSGINGLKYAFEAGKAYLRGERPNVDDQVSRKVEL